MPSNTQGPRSVDLNLKGLGIIVWILAGVLLLFVGVAFLAQPLVAAGADAEGGPPTAALLGVLVFMIPLECVAYVFLARHLKPQWKDEAKAWKPDGPLPRAFVTQVILGTALTDGIGLFAAVIYLMTGSFAALGIAIAAAAVLIYQVPSADALRNL
ncbi:MAG: hypothetical protein P1V81_03760 [Planctomycetota bacterium]|nr:hypothetical protein [Planctomycetota bacterium]